jgi:hypothetical protein
MDLDLMRHFKKETAAMVQWFNKFSVSLMSMDGQSRQLAALMNRLSSARRMSSSDLMAKLFPSGAAAGKSSAKTQQSLRSQYVLGLITGNQQTKQDSGLDTSGAAKSVSTATLETLLKYGQLDPLSKQNNAYNTWGDNSKTTDGQNLLSSQTIKLLLTA